MCLVLTQPLSLAPSVLPSPVSAQHFVHQKLGLCKDFLIFWWHRCSVPLLETLRRENVQSEENLENTQPNKNPNYFFPPQFFLSSEEASELTVEMSGRPGSLEQRSLATLRVKRELHWAEGLAHTLLQAGRWEPGQRALEYSETLSDCPGPAWILPCSLGCPWVLSWNSSFLDGNF